MPIMPLTICSLLITTLIHLPQTLSLCSPTQQCNPPPPLPGALAPSTGTLHATLLIIDFPDAISPDSESPTSLYTYLSGSTTFFTTSSFSTINLSITPQLSQFYRMPSPSSTYNFARGFTAADHEVYIRDALTAVGDTIDFSGTDVLYILPTRAASEISFSPTAMFPVVAGDGTVIGNTVTFGQDLYDFWGFKVLNHETGHAMGLPDLYPFSPGLETGEYVGGFSLMGDIGGQSPDYFGVHKWQLGWLGEGEVVCVGGCGEKVVKLSPVEERREGEGVKLIVVPINETFDVLVEARSGRGVDEGACGVGVLVYTSDTSVASGYGPIRVIDSKPGSGGCDSGKGGELNDAPLQLGEVLADDDLGVRISVQCKTCGDEYTVLVERT